MLVFGGWIASLEAGLRHDRVKLAIKGYDRRDLLSGHYVLFRLISEREAAALLPREARPPGGQISFCAEVKDGFVHPQHVRAPGDACSVVLTGEVWPEAIRFGQIASTSTSSS